MSGLIGRRHTGRVSDAPAYRLWPPVALGVPLLVGMAALQWGAVLPEERYLSAKFGAEYDAYRHRTRRWC